MTDRNDKYLDVTVTPTITAGAYSQYDVVGGLLTFAAPSSSAGVLLGGFKMTDKGNKANAFKVFIFDAVPDTTAIANNAAMSLAAADLPMIVDDFSIAAGDWKTYSSLGYYAKWFSPPLMMQLGANASVYLYMQFTAASPTDPASTSDLSVTLRFLTSR